MPSKAWKNATTSSTTSPPTTFDNCFSSTWLARINDLVGAMSALYNQWSRSRANMLGESRNASALRLGGVSTITRS